MTPRSLQAAALGLLLSACVAPIGPQTKDAATTCQFDVDCKSGQTCVTGVCTSPAMATACQFDVDCKNGQVCTAGSCTSPDAAISNSKDGSSGSEDSGFPPSYCESCANNGECGTGGTCFTQNSMSFCTYSCLEQSNCPSGSGCFPVGSEVDGSSPQLCFPVSNGGKCPANSGAADGGMNGFGGRDGGRGPPGDAGYPMRDGGFPFGDGGFPMRDGGRGPPPMNDGGGGQPPPPMTGDAG